MGGVKIEEIGLRDKFWRWPAGNKKKAVVAVGHGLLLQVYQVLQN
jgi:hypothetical protein